ncbi:MAG: SAM-dependent methyltransferase [Flavobacteriales bacterium]|nr:MAG: SAM-dependent methyltransferase [Flavobacteriales bacterium]
MNDDAIGGALLDYYNNESPEDIIVKSSISEDDVIPVPYLFRSAKELPKLEKKALLLCKGKVLDVGAAAGCHSIILKEKGINISAIDISLGAVKVMQKRNLNAQEINFYNVIEQYDTLLFLMNGVGIAGTLKGLDDFLIKAKSLLNEGGQILIDSSDISYMFKEEDGSMWVDLNAPYYGEVTYQMQYKNLITDKFDWLFVDFKTLKDKATEHGFNIELVFEDENDAYLARLIL